MIAMAFKSHANAKSAIFQNTIASHPGCRSIQCRVWYHQSTDHGSPRSLPRQLGELAERVGEERGAPPGSPAQVEAGEDPVRDRMPRGPSRSRPTSRAPARLPRLGRPLSRRSPRPRRLRDSASRWRMQMYPATSARARGTGGPAVISLPPAEAPRPDSRGWPRAPARRGCAAAPRCRSRRPPAAAAGRAGRSRRRELHVVCRRPSGARLRSSLLTDRCRSPRRPEAPARLSAARLRSRSRDSVAVGRGAARVSAPAGEGDDVASPDRLLGLVVDDRAQAGQASHPIPESARRRSHAEHHRMGCGSGTKGRGPIGPLYPLLFSPRSAAVCLDTRS